MTNVSLLSNGKYHVDIDEDGSGRSRHEGLAVTRWREDSAGNPGGTYFYLRELGGDVWSPTRRPVVPAPPADVIAFDPESTTFSRRHADIETQLAVAVAKDGPFELRRLSITNRSSQRRPISVTSYGEIVLSPPATDAAHVAFSKLFVETAVDPSIAAIFATRRPSQANDPRTWFFHTAIVRGVDPSGVGSMSFETDRMRFVGRGGDLTAPATLRDDAAPAGQEGPTLDAVASIRIPLVLEPAATCAIDWFTGLSGSQQDCAALVRSLRDPAVRDDVLARSRDYRQTTLRALGISPAEAKGFEQLAASILVADAGMRGPSADIVANRRGQSGLWGFGISGDLPVVVVRCGETEAPERVLQTVRAHAFWRAFGLQTEIAIVSAGDTSGGSYERLLAALRGSPAASLIDKPGGIFLRPASALDDGDRLLLNSVARLVIDTSTPAERPIGRPARFPAPVQCPNVSSPLVAARSVNTSRDRDLIFFNGYGGMAANLSEYVVETSVDRMTPAPWTNVIANPAFGTLVSESGSSSTWSENSREYRLTPWSNDPVGDPNTEALYIRDEATGAFWSPTLLPTRCGGRHVARHGFGYSRFEHTADGIETSLCVFVAADAPVKFSALTLRNCSGRARRLSVTGYVEWVLGDERTKTAMQVVTEIDVPTGAIFARNSYNSDFSGRTAFFDVDREEGTEDFGACGDRADFIGRDGTLAAPQALRRHRLSGRVGAALDPCAALRVAVELADGAEREIVFRLGAGRSAAHASELMRSWRGAGASARALQAVRAQWRTTLGSVVVTTPSPAVDALANGWLLYQVIGSRLWGRTAFYQSSGAFGFRDQLQDVMALVHAAPALVRKHLLLAASRQFVEGDVQHWWHPPSGKGIRTRCSDDYLWLPFVICRYVEVTGEAGVLDENVSLLQGAPLAANAASDYGLPTVATASASLYEHGVRAIRHGLRFGGHGLPLMGTGDWNDGMNLVGAGGRGESVWLAFFLVAVLKRFAPLARSRSDTAFADLCDREAARLTAQVEATSWDGAWYRRAYFDDGSPLGSASNRECRIDSIAQSWSVLSGAAPKERAERAMASLHEHLVRPQARLVQLLAPPFDTSTPSPGYIQGYVPGVRENGGQYTHAAIWAAMAYAELGDGERAWELFGLLDPLSHAASVAQAATYKVEPYVVAGDVYAYSPHVGRGGWTWYTGSAGWMYQLLVESLLGLRRRGDRLRVEPLLPNDWPGFSARYRHGRSVYEITCRRADADVPAGVRVAGIPSPDGTILLHDDGGIVAVDVGVAQDRPRRQ